MSFVTRFGAISLPLPAITARFMLRILVPAGLARQVAEGYGRPVLRPGDPAPDFSLSVERTLHGLLRARAVVLYFFPKAFTPG
jgi:hypothetical protein